MVTKIKFYALLTCFLAAFGVGRTQVATLEMIEGLSYGGPTVISGNGFGPRTTNHVVTFVKDAANNTVFTSNSPTVTASFALDQQQYTGFTYGSGGSYPISTGLVFGAGPSFSTGGSIQEVAPLNSYELLGAYVSGVGGPVNNMFTSNPGSPGSGIQATGTEAPFGNDNNAGVEIFTCTQRLYDLAQPYGNNNRYYYGDLVISFNRFIPNPVLHIAGLGGSYRYLPAGQPNVPANYLSAFFSTELEYTGFQSLTKLSGTSFMAVSGKNILNNAAAPNGGSTPNSPPEDFDNNGAATGSVRINGAVNVIRLKIYLRGSDASQFGWSSAGVGVVSGATRSPLTGDVWRVSVSFDPAQLITLPVTGVNLSAALNGNDVTLHWKTLTESNSDQFEIERSTDGINFSRVGCKAATGNSTSEINYNYTDPGMQANIYYYRLKMVDLDGQYSYSNVAIIRKTGGIRGIRAFPNPSRDNINLEFSNTKGNYVIAVLNQAGQELKTSKINITNAVQYVTVERGGLPPGLYIARISNVENNETFLERIIFQK